MSLQLISVLLQATVMVIFVGSLIVARRNLLVYRQQGQASLLKTAMEDYRALVADDVFDNYHQELEEWRASMRDRDGLQPHMAYYTKFSNISRVGFFYDHLGLIVRQGLLDFEMCFEVVPMPYKFWDDTREFRELMKKATYSEFWDPFEYLYDRYMAERRVRGQVADIDVLLARKPGVPSGVRETPSGRLVQRVANLGSAVASRARRA